MTIFEREPRLGGRVQSFETYVSDDFTDGYPVELGGSTFDADDDLIEKLADDVGVKLFHIPQDESPLASASSWDGRELTANQGCVLERSLEGVCQVSQPSFGPDKDLLGEFARSWGISTEPQKRMSHWLHTKRLLERAIRISGSSLKLNAAVTRITRFPDLTYDVHWTHTNLDGTRTDHVENFGAVFIAAPFHQANIEIQPPLTVQPKEISYKPLHVTHFASDPEKYLNPINLDPRNFNLAKDNIVPTTIWDLRNQSQRQADTDSSVPPFLTLTREMGIVREGCVVGAEYLYRVTSEQPFTDDDIATLFNKTRGGGVTLPYQFCDTIESKLKSEGRVNDFYEFRDRYMIAEYLWGQDYNSAWFQMKARCVPHNPAVNWVHRQFWPNAVVVPDGNASDTEDRNEIAPKLFYVSDFERRQGASMSGSLKSAEEAARSLRYYHIQGPGPFGW